MDAFYNRTVTIWNRYESGGIWDNETWYPTVIENARLIISRGNNIQKSGNSAADSARLHIMDGVSTADKPFLSYADWIASEDKGSYYTLCANDMNFFTEGDTSGLTPGENFFKTVKAQVENCFLISSVDRFEIIPHWEIWGK